jgi:REP element-mobilizing transposase RayT
MPGAYSNLLYHLVFSTKERRPLIAASMKPRLREYVRGIVRSEKGELLEFDGAEDHVHLLVRLHPARAIADTLRMIKANSSKWMNETDVSARADFCLAGGLRRLHCESVTGFASLTLHPRPRGAPSKTRLP